MRWIAGIAYSPFWDLKKGPKFKPSELLPALCQMSLTLGGCQQPLIMLGLLVVLKIKLEKNMI